MGWGEVLGYLLYAFLLGGLGWALVDLFARIRRQPKRPLDMLRMTSYPFVPDDEILHAGYEPEPAMGKLRLSPVPVERQPQIRRKQR